MKYSGMGAVFVVFLVCVIVALGSLFMLRKDGESDRLTERAEAALEERDTASTLVPKSVCLELLIDARTTKQDEIGLYQSGIRWIAYLNAIAALLSFLVIARMVKAKNRYARE